MNGTNTVFMLLIPNGTEKLINDDYYMKKINTEDFPNHMDWLPGSLVSLVTFSGEKKTALDVAKTSGGIKFAADKSAQAMNFEIVKKMLVEEKRLPKVKTKI